MSVKGEVQDAHAGQANSLAQGGDFGCDDAKILGDNFEPHLVLILSLVPPNLRCLAAFSTSYRLQFSFGWRQCVLQSQLARALQPLFILWNFLIK